MCHVRRRAHGAIHGALKYDKMKKMIPEFQKALKAIQKELVHASYHIFIQMLFWSFRIHKILPHSIIGRTDCLRLRPQTNSKHGDGTMENSWID